MNKVDVKIVNLSTNDLPEFKKMGDAGMDIRANCPEGPMTFLPGITGLVPTGLYIAVPHGYEMQVRPRSGLALKYGITVLNSPGTIDSGYRGEVGVIIHNAGKGIFKVNHGDRIAQMVLKEQPYCNLIQVHELPKSERGGDGFGSTGKE